MPKTSVAIIDDHPVVRRGIAVTFAEQKDFEVVGEGACADDAVRIANEREPQLFIIDVNMPGGGIEAVKRVLMARKQAIILMLSVQEDLTTVRAALRAGASGYISKGVDGGDLVVAARRVLAGECHVSPSLAARLLVSNEDQQHPQTIADPRGLASLTHRERQIFELLGKGQSNQDIAARIGLSENTVKHYMTQLMQKLGVRNRTEAALLARSRDPSPPS